MGKVKYFWAESRTLDLGKAARRLRGNLPQYTGFLSGLNVGSVISSRTLGVSQAQRRSVCR